MHGAMLRGGDSAVLLEAVDEQIHAATLAIRFPVVVIHRGPEADGRVATGQ